MAFAGHAARTRRRALHVFLIALIAVAGLVFAAQAAHAAGSARGSATGTVAVAAPGFATGTATGAARNGAISVTIDDGRLTLSAPGARLDHVLHRIAAEAGFKVIIRGDLRIPSPYATMTRVPLERALQRLFDGTAMVIVYEPLREDGAERIAEVRFYAPRPPAPEARPQRAPDGRRRRAPSRRGPRRRASRRNPGRPGTFSSGAYFIPFFWSFLTQGPSVLPCVTGAARPALGGKETLRLRVGSTRVGRRTPSGGTDNGQLVQNSNYGE
jgi:hypothetical protein